MNLKFIRVGFVRFFFTSGLFAFLSASHAQSISLPVYEGFDGAVNPVQYRANSGVHGLPGWNYTVNNTRGRLSFRTDFETHTGSRYIATMDNPGGESTNHLILNINAAGLLVANDQVLLSFDWFDHGDEGDVADIVEVRGSSTDSWVNVYSFAANSDNGSWTKVRDIDLSSALSVATQQFSSSTQIRFGQNDNFPVNTDGISIEDVSIEVAGSQDSESVSPEILIAKMVNYTGRDVVSGNEIEYKVSIINPSDVGAQIAGDVMFELPTFASETVLVPGSVITSQGSVITGNTAGDTSISVNLGDLSDGSSATLYFRAVATFDGDFQFSNQGQVSSNNVAVFMTEDPTINSGSADPTLANFVFPTTLPIYENFSKATATSYVASSNAQNFLINGLDGWSYQGDTAGRLQLVDHFNRRTGSGLIASMDNPGGGGINRTIVSFDASDLSVIDDQLLLAFDWFDHGDEGDSVDVVEVRGSSSDSWIEVYDFATNSNNGSWTQVRNINLSTALTAASSPQGFSESVQVRFSQTDNFPINTDGISIEDVSIEVAPAASESDSLSPEILIASMLDYDGLAVTEGDSLEYKVSIVNKQDSTGDIAGSVVFELAAVPSEFDLVVGSIFTSKGTVTTGNTVGETSIRVEFGDIPDGESETVYFRTVPKFTGTLDFSIQGKVSSTNVVEFNTQDPTRNAGASDSTIASFAKIQRAVTNLAIDDAQPLIGDRPTATATGSGSSVSISFSSDTPSICSAASNGDVELLGRGTCTIRASQSGDAIYLDATQSTLSFFVDNDIIDDSVDNCPVEVNTDQADLDNDGVGDVCDTDRDGDQVLDNVDNCPVNVNTNQSDLDADGVGDVCDTDRDGDQILDSVDNCPVNVNTNQSDLDGDGAGDVCDTDRDGDQILDSVDNCPFNQNQNQVDFEGDGVGDACDSDTDGDGISDAFENQNGLNPRNSFDRDADPDRDGFTNLEEFEFGTDPNVVNVDTNNNGIPDSTEGNQSIMIKGLPSILILLLDD